MGRLTPEGVGRVCIIIIYVSLSEENVLFVRLGDRDRPELYTPGNARRYGLRSTRVAIAQVSLRFR